VPTVQDAQRRLLELSRVIYDPLTGQPFPGNVIRGRSIPRRRTSCAALPEPNTAGTRTTARPSTTTDQPDQTATTTRSTSRSTHVRPRNRFSSATATRRRTRPAGDAAARRRGATFGAGDGDIKAQSLRSTTAHIFGAG
jgi:hypothetical protein